MSACGSRAVGPVQEPTTNEPGEDVVKAVQGAVEQYRQAYEVHSVEALAAIYSHDLDLSLVYQGRLFRGWSQVEAHLAERLSGASKVRMTIKDTSVQDLGGSSALATTSLEITVGDDATSVTETGTLSLIFQKSGDNWLVVAEHFSYPTGAS